jgi:hypothetical protein
MTYFKTRHCEITRRDSRGSGAIRLLQDLLEGYEPKGNGVGMFYDHNIGTYSIK